MKNLTLHFLFAAMIACTATIASAQQMGTTDVPRTISYQGLLTTNDGLPLPDGTYDITVSLFASEDGSNPIWQHTYTTGVVNGIFNLYLGSGNAPLPKSQDMNRPLWVGTSVNGSDFMKPLTPLTSSPYALNLPDQAVTTSKLADDAVTAEKVDMPYLAGLRINGQDIIGKGAMVNIQSGKDIDIRYDEVSESVVIESKSATGTLGGEKGAATQDAVTATGNWIGRDFGTFGGLFNPAIGTSTTYNTAVGGASNAIADNADHSTVVGGKSNTIGDGSDADFIGGGSENTIGDEANYNGIVGGELNAIGDATTHNCIGCGESNTIQESSNLNVIGGGSTNTVFSGADYNVIGGGNTNRINQGDNNAVGGGSSNTVNPGSNNTIAGGGNNSTGVSAGIVNYAAVGGGQSNVSSANHSTISGGQFNAASAGFATVGGGSQNAASATYATVAGGQSNAASGTAATVGGGQSNVASGITATVSGGTGNSIFGDGSVVSGGTNNNINGTISTIGGGDGHTINADEATIAGGHINTVESYASAIVGGHDNIISSGSDFGLIGGGQANMLNNSGMVATIGGGQNNVINNSGEGSFIGGGRNNQITGPISTIGGGEGHIIDAPEATIAGGHINTVRAYVGAITGGHDNVIGVSGDAGFIGGGRNNTVDDLSGAIGGGNNNMVVNGASFAFIGGGEANLASAPFSTIGGGQGNNAAGSHSTLFGGEALLTNASYAQSAVGFLNAPRGTVPVHPTTLTDDPLFMVGNGTFPLARSNAFEVSYNGHSVVYDVNGTGAIRPAIKGATYTDNVIYGWAEVDADGGLICDDFGILEIGHPSTGVYRITLNISDPDGITGRTISCGAVVATVGTGMEPGSEPEAECPHIRTSTIVNNVFEVYITETSAEGGECGWVDRPFKFHVTGRIDP